MPFATTANQALPVVLTPELTTACAEGLVLTPNERLRRAVERSYNAAQLAAGRTAWLSPNVMTLDGYLSERYAELRALRPNLPQLLGPEAELVLFRQTAPADAEALAGAALQAWNLALDWRIELDRDTLAQTENGRLLLDWTHAVTTRLEKGHLITRAELPGWLADQDNAGPRTLVCLAFEQTPAAVTHLLARLSESGTRVSYLDPPGLDPVTEERLEFATPAAELAAAAQWALATVRADPQARVGIVVPDLGQRHHAVTRQFGAYFAPLGAPVLPFDIAGGVPLGQQPIWTSALDWLRLSFTSLPSARIPTVLNSRYLELPDLAELPATAQETLSLRELAAQLQDTRLTELADSARASSTAAATDGAPLTLHGWLRVFQDQLEAARWTGQNAGTVQFQAWQQIQAALRNLELADRAGWRCSAEQALEIVQAVLAARLFAPERPAAQVEVLGYLETTGLRFTHLWVSGMADTAWPGPVTPNPLIPVSTQRSAGVPRVDSSGEHAFAAERLARWRRSAKHLRFSHALEDGETHHEASALLSSLAVVHPEAPSAAASHPFLQWRAQAFERDDDPYGSGVPAGAVRGGTGLLRDQAACPFRAWAVRRLGLDQRRLPHSFPDPLERGVMVHEALYHLYADHLADRAANADGVAGLPPATAIDRAVTRALAANYRRFPDPYLRTEQLRVTLLLERWLEFERTRAPFTIQTLETGTEITIQGLTLRVRLDRVDEVGGGRVIVDYKTGRAAVKQLLSERLLEPQLPLYAVSDDSVAGVLFAQLDTDNPRLLGLVSDVLDLGAGGVHSYGAAEWEQLNDTWRGQLDQLATEYRSGLAAVRPADPSVCQQCHLTRFCRIRQPLADNESEASA